MVQDLSALRVLQEARAQPPKLVDLIDEQRLPHSLVIYKPPTANTAMKIPTAATSSTENGFPSTYAPIILLTLG